MPFPKNNNANPEGRPKGSQNKDVKNLRGRLSLILDNHIGQVSEDLNSLSPKDRLAALIALLEYALPKLSRVELKSDEKNGFTLNVVNYTQSKDGKEIKELPEEIEQID